MAPGETALSKQQAEQKWQIKFVSKSKYSNIISVGLFTEVEIACLKFAEMKTSQRNVIKPRNVSERQALNRSTFNFLPWLVQRCFSRKKNWSKLDQSLDGGNLISIVHDRHLFPENPLNCILWSLKNGNFLQPAISKRT